MQSVEHFAPEPTAARNVRAFVRQTLSEWHLDGLEWIVSQAVTELATNAILHARTPFTVDLRVEASRLFVDVTDKSPRRIAKRAGTDEASTGRGLALVAHLSDEWGTRAEASGKTVWCSFTIPPSESVSPQAHAI